MRLSRREFIRSISSASLVALGGNVLSLSPAAAAAARKGSKLRFAVASDGHYGQEGTDFDLFQNRLIEHISAFHRSHPLDFCVINGDVVHDQKDFLIPAKRFLDRLPVKYYVTKGNHDKVSDSYWEDLWGMPVNHEVTVKGNKMLLATTSNEAGDYLSPDINWIRTRLEENSTVKNIFVFVHIPQVKWTKNAIDTPAFIELLSQHKNIRGVFHGHEHDQDGVQMIDSLPFMFDSHIGGNWGTSYRGFRVVELLRDNSMLTYLMNPTEKINQASF